MFARRPDKISLLAQWAKLNQFMDKTDGQTGHRRSLDALVWLKPQFLPGKIIKAARNHRAVWLALQGDQHKAWESAADKPFRHRAAKQIWRDPSRSWGPDHRLYTGQFREPGPQGRKPAEHRHHSGPAGKVWTRGQGNDLTGRHGAKTHRRTDRRLGLSVSGNQSTAVKGKAVRKQFGPIAALPFM